jgi:hypothetical protein
MLLTLCGRIAPAYNRIPVPLSLQRDLSLPPSASEDAFPHSVDCFDNFPLLPLAPPPSPPLAAAVESAPLPLDLDLDLPLESPPAPAREAQQKRKRKKKRKGEKEEEEKEKEEEEVEKEEEKKTKKPKTKNVSTAFALVDSNIYMYNIATYVWSTRKHGKTPHQTTLLGVSLEFLLMGCFVLESAT